MKLKVVTILGKIDSLLKGADGSMETVRRNSHNMRYLRTGILGGELVDPGRVLKDMEEMVEASQAPLGGVRGKGKFSSSMKTIATFMLDKAMESARFAKEHPALVRKSKVVRRGAMGECVSGKGENSGVSGQSQSNVGGPGKGLKFQSIEDVKKNENGIFLKC